MMASTKSCVEKFGIGKVGQAAIATIIFITLAGVASFHTRSLQRSFHWGPIDPVQLDKHWLDIIRSELPDLTPTILYTKRCISRSEDYGIDRKSVTSISRPLLQGTQILQVNSSRDILQPSCVPLKLDLNPPPPSVDASSFLFGMSTTIPRLFDSIPQLAQWLGHSKAMIVILVVGGSAGILQAAKDQMTALGIEARLVSADAGLDEHKRHLAILAELYKNQLPGTTKWHVAIDDDTFFPYMPALIDHMRKYDHKKPFYIGALSENQHSVDMYGQEAYGGAGIFISVALADKVHAVFGTCMAHEPAAGDVMIRDCIRDHTETKLTVDDDFHQLDMEGDISGFYESGGMPLSLHHWKSPRLSILPILHMHLVSDYCGACFLQRWRFADDFILTNGYSVVQYPRGINFDLDMMELTFQQNDVPALWRISKLRPKLLLHEKLSYRLLTASKQEDDSIRQVYIRRASEDENPVQETNDQIIELLWSDGTGG